MIDSLLLILFTTFVFCLLCFFYFLEVVFDVDVFGVELAYYDLVGSVAEWKFVLVSCGWVS